MSPAWPQKSAERPNIQRVAQILTNILNSPPAQQIANIAPAPPNPVVKGQTSGAEVAIALGIGAALLAAIGGLAYLASNSPE